MNTAKTIIMMCILLCLASFVLAADDISFEWNGMTTITLDKEVFNGTEPITGTVSFSNFEGAPSLGTKIVLHVAQGEYEYPSQDSKENLIDENIIPADFVLANSTKKTSFSLKNPGNGKYRLDAYVWVSKSKGTGASNIFLNPVSAEFEVKGSAIERATINRAKTSFREAIGPIGFPISPESKFNGTIAIDNLTSKDKSNLSVGIRICEWASAFCTNETETKFNVNSIPAGKSAAVEVNLTGPKIPSAYEIGIVLYDGSNIDSIYKSRVIVSGGTAKIRKISLLGLSDRNYSLNLVVLGSPDHFSYPDFSDFDVTVEAYNKDAVIEAKIVHVATIKTGGIMDFNFFLSSKQFSKICGKIIKGGQVYTSECFDVDLNRLLLEYDLQNPKKIDAAFSYDDFSKVLSITLKKESINAQVRVFDSFNTYYKENILSEGEYKIQLQIEKLNLFLMINDFDSRTQQLIPMNLLLLDNSVDIYGDTNDSSIDALTKKCTGKVCAQNTSCTSETSMTLDGACCYTECIATGAFAKEVLQIPFISWIALIVLIIAIAMIYEIMQKRKRQKRRTNYE